VKAQIRGKYPNSPYKLQVNQTPRGVFFDRVMSNSGHKLLVLHTTPKQARALARWILDNVHDVPS
jgi:hypothetical protein